MYINNKVNDGTLSGPPPFSLPTDTNSFIDDTHQITDTDLDITELYNEGIEGASEFIVSQNYGILGYTPPPK